MRNNCTSNRNEMIEAFFPDGIPELWCPLLTHYTCDGKIDKFRIKAHLKRISPFVKAFLVPGSTGDGWEMNDEEIHEVLEIVLDLAKEFEVQILIGILKTERGAAHQGILDTLDWLKKHIGVQDTWECLKAARVCGFTVCPPKGGQLTQEEIKDELSKVLAIGVPTALYQLPQITENEMSPDVVVNLSDKFSNFFLFKDTSGNDSVALSGLEVGGVFLVRGAEGNYHQWLRTNGGQYYGFLLSTANCFAEELYTIIEHIRKGRVEEAGSLSVRLSEAVAEVFKVAASYPYGNAFTNANKAIDHILAYGAKAASVTGPRLHAGVTIPEKIINTTAEIMARYHLTIETGYLE